MPPPSISVLFVSKENASRSLMAEACLSHLGQGRFKVYSCGVPGKTIDEPYKEVIEALDTAGMLNGQLRCKSWAEFTRIGTPRMDFVIGLDADSYAKHPAWPGQPETALWAMPPLVSGKRSKGDSAGIEAMNTLHALRRRIELLISLTSRGAQFADLRHDLRDLVHL